jgi:DNA-binding HxlR family transcriptional regulator
MRRKSFEAMNCSVAQALEVIGEWWSMLIVRDAFLGVTRFDEIQERLGISRNILADRLEHLVAHGVLERSVYQERPIRFDYRLTAKGRDLWPVLTAMRQWGDRWEAPAGPPVVIEHVACGRVTEVVPCCARCGAALEADEVAALPGPGARLGRAPLPVVRR